MIQKEFYRIRKDGVALYRTYSDEGYYIQKIGTNEVYAEAIDVYGAPYIYEETSEKIEKDAFVKEQEEENKQERELY